MLSWCWLNSTYDARHATFNRDSTLKIESPIPCQLNCRGSVLLLPSGKAAQRWGITELGTQRATLSTAVFAGW